MPINYSESCFIYDREISDILSKAFDIASKIDDKYQSRMIGTGKVSAHDRKNIFTPLKESVFRTLIR